MSPLAYEWNVVTVGTGPAGIGQAVWVDSEAAAIRRDSQFPQEPSGAARIDVLDFHDIVPAPGPLLEFLVPLAEGVVTGRYGENHVVFVSTRDDATREFVQYLSTARNLPIYVASSIERLSEATPAGELTATERETLDVLARAGGTLTATQFATSTGTAVTTGGNRLVNLARRGYILRVPQSGRAGDLFIDPRSLRPYSAL
jgi:hypothetical protein